MDFRLTKEQALVQKMCREFAVNEVEPIAAEIDAEERYPFETVEKMRKYGLMGIQFPRNWAAPAATPSATLSLSKKHPASAAPPAVLFLLTQRWALGRSSSTAPLSRRRSGCVR